MRRPRLTILGGPNGAGKTTLAQSSYTTLLENDRFLNADWFADKLSPDGPADRAVAAARHLIRLRRKWMNAKFDFILETTLATRTLLNVIHDARVLDYKVSLVYLWISDPDICV